VDESSRVIGGEDGTRRLFGQHTISMNDAEYAKLVEDCPFEILGFFERLIDARTNKALGTRTVGRPDRPLGSAGMLEYDITETVTLRRGHKEMVLAASPKKPWRVIGQIEIFCGRVKSSLKCDWEVMRPKDDDFAHEPCGRSGKPCTSGPAQQVGHIRCPQHMKGNWRDQ